jgi:hypothetical protein
VRGLALRCALGPLGSVTVVAAPPLDLVLCVYVCVGGDANRS